ncbi:uncharacterized protein BDZ99DRAFT_466721 [Mytilinidion resinicola]|uniref:Uncharacterized protein n=1 Tax=Mytilinidion resinicola TaxID=574789 RepID=A0A6A6Y887_9PEZI|nr:uncharacterized protein BDZ99DRAFT_466721 [Mytilinidion resinicola]KAF2805051.1 hypothetical protein BDZ99DRAFT_466721 [Mytilinidion resinicola]
MKSDATGVVAATFPLETASPYLCWLEPRSPTRRPTDTAAKSGRLAVVVIVMIVMGVGKRVAWKYQDNAPFLPTERPCRVPLHALSVAMLPVT